MLRTLSTESLDVLLLALELAQSLDHDCIASEHLLLGLVGQRETLSGKLLKEAGFEISELQVLISNTNHCHSETFPLPSYFRWLRRLTGLPLSLHGKQLLESARRQADEWQQCDVCPEHILLGLLELPSSEAQRIFALKSVSPEGLRNAVLTGLGRLPCS
jgi:ATP-dependent Clp protease ATP-binding subunit ClpA